MRTNILQKKPNWNRETTMQVRTLQEAIKYELRRKWELKLISTKMEILQNIFDQEIDTLADLYIDCDEMMFG